MNIKVFGKTIAAVYSHIIMSVERGAVRCSEEAEGYDIIKLDPFDESAVARVRSAGTTVSLPNLKRTVESNPGKCEGFLLKELASEKYVGTVFVMYRGGNDIEYRIRSTDAYIFDVFISEEYRGRGLAGVIIKKLMDYLGEKGIDKACLAVSKKNAPAIRAYEKTGFVAEGEKTFLRLLKLNIPYHKL